MKEKNLIILTIAAIILIALLTFTVLGTQQNNINNTTNDTINISLNSTNNTNNTTNKTQTQTTTQTKKKTQTTKKSNEPDVVSDSVDYNYQVDDGSYIRTVEYSDGSFKQYDMDGREISPGDMT